MKIKVLMKEIIIVTNYLTDGGAERVLSELMVEWVKQGNHVLVVQTRASFFSDTYDLPNEVEVLNIKMPKCNSVIRRFNQAYQLLKILRAHKNATVLAMLNPAILLVGMCSPFIKNRIVFSERCDPEQSPPSKLYRFVRDNLYRCADCCVFQTIEAKEHFCKSVQEKGVIIPNPINDDLPLPYKGERRKVIVAVSRLDRQKNLSMLLHAFKMLTNDYPEYILEIYGRGQLEEQLRQEISTLGLDGNIFLMGFSYNVYDKMRDATMYVSSSNYEGISNSMLEALGMGIPTVCTDCPCGGARTYIKNDYNGLLVPVGDIDALYRAMKRILDNPEFASYLSVNAYKIRKELPLNKIADKWLSIL